MSHLHCYTYLNWDVFNPYLYFKKKQLFNYSRWYIIFFLHHRPCAVISPELLGKLSISSSSSSSLSLPTSAQTLTPGAGPQIIFTVPVSSFEICCSRAAIKTRPDESCHAPEPFFLPPISVLFPRGHPSNPFVSRVPGSVFSPSERSSELYMSPRTATSCVLLARDLAAEVLSRRWEEAWTASPFSKILLQFYSCYRFSHLCGSVV